MEKTNHVQVAQEAYIEGAQEQAELDRVAAKYRRRGARDVLKAIDGALGFSKTEAGDRLALMGIQVGLVETKLEVVK